MFQSDFTRFIVISHVSQTISQHLLSYHMFLKRYHDICCHITCFSNDITTFVVISPHVLERYQNICCHIKGIKTILQHLLSFTGFSYHNICCHITGFYHNIYCHITISQHLLSYHMFLERYHNIYCHITCFSNDITTFVIISHVLERYHNICCHITCFSNDITTFVVISQVFRTISQH